MKQIDLVIDLQFGSTGKGLLVGWLAKTVGYDTIITSWAPNSGHTFIDENNRKYVHTMLANGIVSPWCKRVLIGPGSVLNLDSLNEEIIGSMDHFEDKKISIFIHPQAAIVSNEDRQAESESMTAIGSTKKGTGAATIRKIQRNPNAQVTAWQHIKENTEVAHHPVFEHEFVKVLPDTDSWLEVLDLARSILVEGAQGFGLSMHHGFYPYTTSRDVTPMQIAADCGVPFAMARRAQVYGTCRTYPIRVANRYDDYGNQVGWSGPHYSDQEEIKWESLNMKPELTTVTKLPRRLFTYSAKQMRVASTMCSPGVVFLNFVNYIKDWNYFGRIYESIRDDCQGVHRIMYGVGPTARHVLIGNINSSAASEWDYVQAYIRSEVRPSA